MKVTGNGDTLNYILFPRTYYTIKLLFCFFTYFILYFYFFTFQDFYATLKVTKYSMQEETFAPLDGLTLRDLTTCRSCPTHDCTTLLRCLNCTQTTDCREQSAVTTAVLLYFIFISFPLKRQQIKQCNYLPNTRQTANMLFYVNLIALPYICIKKKYIYFFLYIYMI